MSKLGLVHIANIINESDKRTGISNKVFKGEKPDITPIFHNFIDKLLNNGLKLIFFSFRNCRNPREIGAH